MKKICLIFITMCIIQVSYAQNVGFRSNGHVNNFKKIDTLYFNEYEGQRPTTKTADIDTIFSRKIIKVGKGFGFNMKSKNEGDKIKAKLKKWKKKFTTSYYVYGDGTLQAPTSELFFKPQKEKAVFSDFAKFGTVVAHDVFKGYYYLELKTEVYDNGDKIFALCDSLYNAKLAAVIEPVFIR